MKVIIENNTGLSKYTLQEDTTVDVTTNNIVVGDPVEFIISDLNASNATVYSGVVDTPDDWYGNKYFFDGENWVLNSDWSDPVDLDKHL